MKRGAAAWMTGNVIFLRSRQFWCQTTSSDSHERLLAQLVLENECTHVLPVPCTCPLAACVIGLVVSLKRAAGNRQKNRGAVAAAQSWYNLIWPCLPRPLSPGFVSGSYSWFFSQTIPSAPLWESAREKEITISLSAHTEQTSLLIMDPLLLSLWTSSGCRNTASGARHTQKNAVWLLPLPQFETCIFFQLSVGVKSERVSWPVSQLARRNLPGKLKCNWVTHLPKWAKKSAGPAGKMS